MSYCHPCPAGVMRPGKVTGKCSRFQDTENPPLAGVHLPTSCGPSCPSRALAHPSPVRRCSLRGSLRPSRRRLATARVPRAIGPLTPPAVRVTCHVGATPAGLPGTMPLRAGRRGDRGGERDKCSNAPCGRVLSAPLATDSLHLPAVWPLLGDRAAFIAGLSRKPGRPPSHLHSSTPAEHLDYPPGGAQVPAARLHPRALLVPGWLRSPPVQLRGDASRVTAPPWQGASPQTEHGPSPFPRP